MAGILDFTDGQGRTVHREMAQIILPDCHSVLDSFAWIEQNPGIVQQLFTERLQQRAKELQQEANKQRLMVSPFGPKPKRNH